MLKGECAIQNESFHKKSVIKHKRTAYAKIRQLTCPNWFALMQYAYRSENYVGSLDCLKKCGTSYLNVLFVPEASISMDIYVFLRFPTHITRIK